MLFSLSLSLSCASFAMLWRILRWWHILLLLYNDRHSGVIRLSFQTISKYIYVSANIFIRNRFLAPRNHVFARRILAVGLDVHLIFHLLCRIHVIYQIDASFLSFFLSLGWNQMLKVHFVDFMENDFSYPNRE